MAGNQGHVDGLTGNIAGMSKKQLYDIMSQMKTLIEQNQQQARQILIQNPLLTKALFQAQIMLGMVQPPKVMPSIQSASSLQPQPQQQPQLPPQPAQQSSNQASQSQLAQAGLQDQPGLSQTEPSLRKQTPSQSPMPTSPVVTPAANVHSHHVPSHTLQVPQQSIGHSNFQGIPMSLPQSMQLPNTPLPFHSASQPPSLHHSQMPIASSQLQQTTVSHMPLQPPMPPQHRPTSAPNFQQQYLSQAGSHFQYPGPPHYPSQPMYHSGNRPPPSIGHSFLQGQPPFPNQPPSQPLYQGGSSHSGPDFIHNGSSMQVNRGSSWPPPHSENPAATQLPGPSQLIPGQMGPGNHPPRPAPLTPDMEKALLQQVMSLTPEQINLLPSDQRNQVLQLQQMLRQ